MNPPSGVSESLLSSMSRKLVEKFLKNKSIRPGIFLRFSNNVIYLMISSDCLLRIITYNNEFMIINEPHSIEYVKIGLHADKGIHYV